MPMLKNSPCSGQARNAIMQQFKIVKTQETQYGRLNSTSGRDFRESVNNLQKYDFFENQGSPNTYQYLIHTKKVKGIKRDGTHEE